MGIRAAASLGAGVALGFASYWASRVPRRALFDGALIDHLDITLTWSRRHISNLNQHGIAVPSGVRAELDRLIRVVRPHPGIAGDPHGLQGPIEALRGDVRACFRPHPAYWPIYDLGVAISLAEGQAHSSS